jgi:hypothetical protein
MRACLLLLALGSSLGAEAAAAQSMRPFSTYRQWHGETRLTARLDYAAGSLRLAAGRPNELYRMDASYDSERFLPLSDYDAGNGGLAFGFRPAGRGGIRVVSQHQLRQSAEVAFSPRTDLALDLALGAVDGDLELGGLRLTDLHLSTGASRTVVRFSQPNGTRCRSASLTAGAAEVSVLGLGNSRCDRITFEGGMGKVLLDFAGVWSSSSQVDVSMALGELTLRLPRKVGVRITPDNFLASFQPEGLQRSGSGYVSAGYATAARHLDISLRTAVGGVKIDWVE